MNHNKIKKQTEADMNKLKTVTNEQLIMALFDLSDEDYSMLVFNTGIDYAKRRTDNDAVGFDFLIKTKFYWAWWKKEWRGRDDAFIDTYSATAEQCMLYDQYLFQHNIYRLKSDGLMQKKAASMIGYCMDEYMKDGKEKVK